MTFPGEWTADVADIENEYVAPGALAGCTVLWAEYETGSWEGTSTVVYRDAGGQVFCVTVGHCSFNGLEGQWSPEATTLDALIADKYISEEMRAALEAAR